MRSLRLPLLAALLAVPASVFADYSLINNAVNSVGNVLPFFVPSGLCNGSTGCGIVDIAAGVVARFRPALTIAAVLVMVIYGYRMIIGQEEDALTKSRAIMSSTIAGLIMAYLIDPFIAAFYGSSGEVSQGNMAGGVLVLSTEVEGIINWALTIVASLAVLFIILTVVKSVAQGTSEEAVGNIRKTVFSVVFGLVLLAFRYVLSGGFVASTGNPVPMLDAALTFVSYVMGFLALAALIVVIYAGFLCVLNMGSEENFTKAKSLLTRAAIGAIVILMSLALVNFVILPGVQ